MFDRLVRASGGLALALLAGAALVGCGGSTASAAPAGAAAAATATCPPAQAFKTVTGRVSAVGNGTISVTGSDGTTTQVLISSSTRMTQTLTVPVAALVADTPVLVLTDTNVTTAKSIRVLNASGGGFGGQGAPGQGTPGQGTPGTRAGGRFNPACVPQRGQGQGQGQGTGFQGLRGKVDAVQGNSLVFEDAQGQVYTVAITPSTVIERTATAKASDLRVGETVTAAGTQATNGLNARMLVIRP